MADGYPSDNFMRALLSHTFGVSWYDRHLNGGPDDGGQDEAPICPHCHSEIETDLHICPDSDTSEPLG